MADLLRRIRALGAELKGRRVARVGAIYIAAAYAVLGVADLVFPAVGVPDWVLALLLLAAVCGLPAALGLSWIFDLTPDGLRRSPGPFGTPASAGMRFAFGSLVVGASLAMGAGGWWLWLAPRVAAETAPRPAEPGLDPARIAVLYFDDHSPGAELGYLVNGLTEGLIHELAQVDGLEVLSRNAVKPFRQRDVTLDSVVAALRAGSVVEGSLTRSGDRLRLTVQLIDGASGLHLDSRVVDHDVGELLALQDTLADEVARGLRERLGREIRRREARSAARSDEAWAGVQRAVAALDDVDSTLRDDPAAVERALALADSLLRAAERLDPAWTEPITLRGEVARRLARARSPVPGRLDPDLAALALGHVARALDRDPADADALELRGRLRAELAVAAEPADARRLRDDAEGDLRAALLADPDHARAWWGLSRMYVNQARFEEARRAAAEALRADAFLEEAPSVVHELYFSAMNQRELDEAVRWCDEGRRRFPDRSNFALCQLFLLASAPAVEPDVDRAWRLVDTLEATVTARSRDQFRAYGTMQAAKVAARAGLADSARAMIRMARGDATPDWLAYDEAHARLLLGEREEALELLDGYLRFKPSAGPLLAEDWWFEALAGDPRFRALTARAGGADGGP